MAGWLAGGILTAGVLTGQGGVAWGHVFSLREVTWMN